MQKILDLREFEKKQAQNELGKAVAEENRIEDTLKMIAQKRIDTVRASDELRDINSLYGAGQYMQLLDSRKDKLLEELAQAKIITEQKREVLREAMQKVKVLEKLKENRFKKWKKEFQLAEDNASDDIVTSKANAAD